MGSTMKPTIFHDRVATALRKWHHTAKRNIKHSHHGDANSQYSSRPATPTHGMSPVHLLHNYNQSGLDSLHTPSPRRFNVENNQWDVGELPSPRRQSEVDDETQLNRESEHERPTEETVSSAVQLPRAPGSIPTRHEIDISLSDFTFHG